MLIYIILSAFGDSIIVLSTMKINFAIFLKCYKLALSSPSKNVFLQDLKETKIRL